MPKGIRTNCSYPEEDIKSWPKNHKRCRRCLEVKPFGMFNKDRNCLYGLFNICKGCRHEKSVSDYRKTPIERLIFHRAKSRAKKRGVEFSLEFSDIVVPEFCPVFGTKLMRGVGQMTDDSPSLDRIDPGRGYLPDNIIVMSQRANRLKCDSTVEELEKLIGWMKENV